MIAEQNNEKIDSVKVQENYLNYNKEGKGNLLAALCNLFVQYEFTDKSTLPTYEMRTILSTLSEQFQLGKVHNFNCLQIYLNT